MLVPSQATALAALTLAALLFGYPPGTAGDWLLGAIGGLASAGAIAALYLGLARGPMGVVAPVTALVAIALPLLYERVVLGISLSLTAALGIALAALAICLTGATGPAGDRSGRVGAAMIGAVGIGAVGGLCIGIFYIVIDRTDPGSGLWPLVSARLAAVAVITAVWLARPAGRAASGDTTALALGAGLLDGLANVLYLIAARLGELGIAATLASLYPATTVLLAAALLGERLARLQLLGLGCATLGLFAMTAGHFT